MKKRTEMPPGHETVVQTAEDTIRLLLSDENLSIEDVAKMTGQTRQNISQSMNRTIRGMRFDSFQKIVIALGYEIIVRKI